MEKVEFDPYGTRLDVDGPPGVAFDPSLPTLDLEKSRRLAIGPDPLPASLRAQAQLERTLKAGFRRQRAKAIAIVEKMYAEKRFPRR